jgi:ubiquinone/menaquinone biosynthesis C-methylase UbiE
MAKGISENWKKIWDVKYDHLQEKPLHVLDGWDSLTEAQWVIMVNKYLKLLKLKPDDDILEVGCGSGAFLNVIELHNSLSGVDYSENAIARVSANLKGDFRVAEAADLPFQDNIFDAVLSVGVFLYFDDLNYAEKALTEMRRVLKPRGCMFIGEINDADKKELYYQIRSRENRETKKLVKNVSIGHLFYEKQFFVDFTKKCGLDTTIIDNDQMGLSFYPGAQYRFSVIMRLR